MENSLLIMAIISMIVLIIAWIMNLWYKRKLIKLYKEYIDEANANWSEFFDELDKIKKEKNDNITKYGEVSEKYWYPKALKWTRKSYQQLIDFSDGYLLPAVKEDGSIDFKHIVLKRTYYTNDEKAIELLPIQLEDYIIRTDCEFIITSYKYKKFIRH